MKAHRINFRVVFLLFLLSGGAQTFYVLLTMYSMTRRCPYLGGIFAQSSMDVDAANMYNRALEDLENVQDISYVLHYQTPGGTQRGDVIIS